MPHPDSNTLCAAAIECVDHGLIAFRLSGHLVLPLRVEVVTDGDVLDLDVIGRHLSSALGSKFTLYFQALIEQLGAQSQR